MVSKTGKVLGLTVALSSALGPATDLGDAAKKAFDEFFGGNPSKVERVVNSDYGVNAAYAGDLDSLDERVEKPTDWTPENLRGIIKDNKVTFIYWKVEGANLTPRGDKIFRYILRDYGANFDRVVILDGIKYGQYAFKLLKDVLQEINPLYKTNYSVPIYSIAGFGVEERIGGVPPEPYEQQYTQKYKPGIERFLAKFAERKRETFLGIKQK